MESEEGDLIREYEGFLTPKKPDVMERLQTFRSNRQSFLDQPPQYGDGGKGLVIDIPPDPDRYPNR